MVKNHTMPRGFPALHVSGPVRPPSLRPHRTFHDQRELIIAIPMRHIYILPSPPAGRLGSAARVPALKIPEIRSTGQNPWVSELLASFEKLAGTCEYLQVLAIF
jgi:hypothetical protein